MEGQLKLTLVSGIFFLKMAVHGVLTDFLYLTIVANFSLFSPNSCVGIFHYSMCIYFLKKKLLYCTDFYRHAHSPRNLCLFDAIVIGEKV